MNANIIIDSEEKHNLFSKNVLEKTIDITQTMYNEFLENERDAFVNAKRHEQSRSRTDYRNGYSYKWYCTTQGRLRLKIPRTRKSGWKSKLVKKFATMDDQLIETIQCTVFSGCSIRLAQPLFISLFGDYISPARISNVLKKIDKEIAEWKSSSLEDKSFDAVIIDGIWHKLWKGHKKIGPDHEKAVSITALGISKRKNERGDFINISEVLDFEIAGGESEKDTSKLIERIYQRGLKAENVGVFISDGEQGIINSISNYYYNVPRQRCVMHKLGNLKKHLREDGYNEIFAKLIMHEAKELFKAINFKEFGNKLLEFKKFCKNLNVDVSKFLVDIDSCATFLKEKNAYKTTGHLENKFKIMRKLTRIAGHYVTRDSLERYFFGQLLQRGYISYPKKLYTKFLT